MVRSLFRSGTLVMVLAACVAATAAGREADCSGSHTYVFKRGVLYRGKINIYLDGGPAAEGEAPIRPDASLASEADFVVGESLARAIEAR